MPSRTNPIRQHALNFQKEYPATLPDRLDFWQHKLGIDKARFLRLIGSSSQDAKQLRSDPWDSILKTKEIEERGWLVEELLCELISLYNYDWIQLRDKLHKSHQIERSHRVRHHEEIEKLKYKPDNDDLLLNQLASGGPRSLESLIKYLSDTTIE